MERPFICIAGKNNISVDVLEYVLKHYGKENICIVCNKTETGENNFQRSLRKYAQVVDVPEYNLEDTYNIENLVFLSLEFDQIIRPDLFVNARLYNIHFSMLPKYKGMYTSAHPILNGEKYTGVTLHHIDAGIDTGDIIDQEMIEIGNCDCRELYFKYIQYGTAVVLRNIDDIIWNRTIAIKQKESESTYYSRNSISYKNITIDLNQTADSIQRQLRAYSFREYQMPNVFEKIIIDSKILACKSKGKPGTIVFESDDYIVINTIDYDIALFIDHFARLIRDCELGDLDDVKNICSYSLKIVNEKDEHGWSPLIVATYNNHVDVVKYLISVGADAFSTNRNGTNLLMYAKEAYIRTGDNTLFKLFKKMGLSEMKKDYSGNSLLDYLSKDGLSMEYLMIENNRKTNHNIKFDKVEKRLKFERSNGVRGGAEQID